MSVGSALTAGLALIAVVGGAAAVGRAAARSKLIGPDGAAERALVGVVAAVAEVLAAALLLASVGLYERWSLVAVQVVVGVVALRATPLRPEGTAQRWSTEGRIAAGVGAALVTLAAIPTVLGMPSVDIDTREYHLSLVAHWVQTGSLWELPFQNVHFFTATHPSNGELVASTVALATGGDHLVYLAPVLWGSITVLAVAALARQLGGFAGAGALAAVAVLTNNIAFHTQAHALATDLTSAGMLLAAVAFSVRAVRTKEAAWIALAGVAVGIGLGSKYTLLVPAAVLVVVVAALLAKAAPTSSARARFRFAWLLPGLLVFAAPWFIRNWLTTGNPVFPQQVQLLGVVLFAGGDSPIQIQVTTMLDHILHLRLPIIGRFARSIFELHGVAPFLAAAGVAGALPKRSRALLAVAGFALVCVFAYLVTPYTGAGPGGGQDWIASGTRYLLPATLLGAALAATLSKRLLNVFAALAISYGAFRIALGLQYRPDLDVGLARGGVAVGVGLVVMVLVSRHPFGFRIPALRTPITKVAAAAAVIVAVPGAVLALDRALDRTSLERFMSQLGTDQATVLGEWNVSGVIGRDLSRRVTSVTPGEITPRKTYTDPERLNAALDESGATVLVVGPMQEAAPPGWRPSLGPKATANTERDPGDVVDAPSPFESSEVWREAGRVESTVIYVRDEAPPAT